MEPRYLLDTNICIYIRQKKPEEVLRRRDGASHTKFLPLHAVVIWPAPALRWDPGDDLVRIGYVAGFAVHAV